MASCRQISSSNAASRPAPYTGHSKEITSYRRAERVYGVGRLISGLSKARA